MTVMTTITLGDAIRHATEKLAAAGIDSPAVDARLLIAHALSCDRTALLARAEQNTLPHDLETIQAFIDRRLNHEPVARILGRREFWGLSFALNEATLEPRPDSETLIDAVLSLFPDKRAGIRILDLGTGTGCLLLALLHEYPKATGVGIDRAPRAVEQAQENARQLGLKKRAKFRVGDWFNGINDVFDLIVCNPPYVTTTEMPDLMLEVRNHDPLAALDGGWDGLDAYRTVLPALPRFLNRHGCAVFEVGQGQAGAVQKMFRAAGFPDLRTFKDLGGVERCVTGRKA